MAINYPDKWRKRHKGICDFKLNYDFYFKWLLNKVMSMIIIEGGDSVPTFDKDYCKMQLILDGLIGVTEFSGVHDGNDGLYCAVGNIGGEPNAYYVPTYYTIANPILGSKTMYWQDTRDHTKNGVLLCNTRVDKYTHDIGSCGLYDLIHQTATLLADNIVSINSCQINTRVQAIFVADSGVDTAAAELVLQDLYAGKPYKIITQELKEKLTVSPLANANVSQSLTQLVELHNYIIANFFQSIGVVANNVMKREILITAEIDSQNSFVNLSLTELLDSWTRGFNEINEMFGTDFTVRLNPVIVSSLIEDLTDTNDDINGEPDEGEPVVAPDQTSDDVEEQSEPVLPDVQEEESVDVPDTEPETETVIEAQEAVIEELAEYLTGESPTEEGGEVESDLQTEDTED